ncbi:hypothetical protein E2C01_005342 [Portunus trituberculatus]|uniref:Uncharacterized protein n=1 Tax=Portunus trituberculatus TaxID=210409 RepID=A0A5B7CU65_PORTR|nr:hypothetical protein [Portunus trituberculatus]
MKTLKTLVTSLQSVKSGGAEVTRMTKQHKARCSGLEVSRDTRNLRSPQVQGGRSECMGNKRDETPKLHVLLFWFYISPLSVKATCELRPSTVHLCTAEGMASGGGGGGGCTWMHLSET